MKPTIHRRLDALEVGGDDDALVDWGRNSHLPLMTRGDLALLVRAIWDRGSRLPIAPQQCDFTNDTHAKGTP